MANRSLSKSKEELKLTRRQTELFQRMIITGNRMCNLLSDLRSDSLYIGQLKEAKKLINKWSKLMLELVTMLS